MVLYWIEQGVKIFRVDNPHTKPFEFWEWLIGEVLSQRGEAVLLEPDEMREYVIDGIKTNIPLHRELMVDARFIEGGTNIHYLEQKLAQEQKKKK